MWVAQSQIHFEQFGVNYQKGNYISLYKITFVYWRRYPGKIWTLGYKQILEYLVLLSYAETKHSDWLNDASFQLWYNLLKGAPRLSLTKYFRDRFSQVSQTIFWGMATSKIPLSRIYSTRLHVSFANLLQWLHLKNLTYFREMNRDRWLANFLVSESRVTRTGNKTLWFAIPCHITVYNEPE